MSIVVDELRTFMAEAIAGKSIYLAWGRGDGVWTSADGAAPYPAEDRAKTALVDPIGFRQAARIAYVEPDPAGEIILSSGAYRISSSETNHLYLEFRFDFSDAQGETIREAMVYVGTTVIADLPAGKKYFIPSEISKVGRAALLDHFGPRERTVGTRSTYEYVISL